MRTIPAATVTAIDAANWAPGFLVQLNLSSVVRFSTRGAITWNGAIFVPAVLAVQNLTDDSSGGTLAFNDPTLAIQSLVRVESLIGKRVQVARFYDGVLRRIINIAGNTIDLNIAPWGKVGGATVVGNAVTFTSTTSDNRLSKAATVNTKGIFVASFTLSSTLPITLHPELVDNLDGSNPASITVNVTSTPVRYSVTMDNSASATFSGVLGLYFNRYSASGVVGAVVTIADVLIEDVTAQTNRNPSSYVPAGAGLPGYLDVDYENGNTVAANIVTEAHGDSTVKPFWFFDGYIQQASEGAPPAVSMTISRDAARLSLSPNKRIGPATGFNTMAPEGQLIRFRQSAFRIQRAAR